MDSHSYYIRFYKNNKFQWAEYIPSFSKLISICSNIEHLDTTHSKGYCKLKVFRETVSTNVAEELVVYTIFDDYEDKCREIIKTVLLCKT